LELTELLQKRRPVNKTLIKEIRQHAHIENIKKHATDLPSLDKYWHHLTAEEKTDSKLAIAATRAYTALENCDMAHEIIEHSIATDWDPELITLYSECLDYHVSRQIEKAEVWLKAQPNNAQLLLTLGKLCTHCELWGKAQNYLEASLSVEQSHAAHLALAQLHEKLGKHELAMDQYNKGLGLTLNQLG
jgi:HemY protein